MGVLHLCGSPWLEEAVTADQIHLFLELESGCTSSRFSTHPYISNNFGGTPVSSSSHNPYTQFQNRQIQNITLYNLAIRLIELGLNKPFEKL